MCAWAGLLCKLDMDLEVITAALWTLLIREEDWSICLCTDFGSVPSRLTHESYITTSTWKWIDL